VAAADGKFMMAIYDHKVNNYECCPTFSFDIGKGHATTNQHAPVQRVSCHHVA
jgi:hypothetical protein